MKTSTPLTVRNLTTRSGYTSNDTLHAEIIKGESIRIFGTYRNRKEPADFDRTFRVGDTVRTGSFNLIYTGKILAIGEKSVSVEGSTGNGKTTRLELFWFAQRNWNLDLVKINEHNNAWLD